MQTAAFLSGASHALLVASGRAQTHGAVHSERYVSVSFLSSRTSGGRTLVDQLSSTDACV